MSNISTISPRKKNLSNPRSPYFSPLKNVISPRIDPSDSHKTVDNLPKKITLYSVAAALNNFSNGIITLDCVLLQIFQFKETLNIDQSHVDSLCFLLTPASSSPDTLYLLLTISAKLILSGAHSRDYALKMFIEKCQEFIQFRPYFVSFGDDQKLPIQECKKMLELFQKALNQEKIPHCDFHDLSFSFGSNIIYEWLKDNSPEFQDYINSSLSNLKVCQSLSKRKRSKPSYRTPKTQGKARSKAPINHNENNIEISNKTEEKEDISHFFPSKNFYNNDTIISNFNDFLSSDISGRTKEKEVNSNSSKMNENSIDTLKFDYPEMIEPTGENSTQTINNIQSSSNIYSEIENKRQKGMKLFDKLAKEEQQKILELSKRFKDWPSAYEASKFVWNIIKNDPTFNIDILLSQIKFCFADFLIIVIQNLALSEGRIHHY